MKTDVILAQQAMASGTLMGMQEKVATVASAIIGSVTFFGSSYVAFGKLAEFLAVKCELKPWQKAVKFGFSAVTALAGLAYAIVVGVLDEDASPNARTIAWLTFASTVAIGGLLLVKKDRFPGINLLKWLARARG